MIYALKHKNTDKFVRAVQGRIIQEPHIWDSAGNIIQAIWVWSGDTSNVKFALTNDILQARQIEDPDMDMVCKFGLEPIPLKLTKGTLEQAYRIL